jgi:hypothetical protein
MIQQTLSAKQEAAILSEYFDLYETGKEAEAHAVITKIPMPSYLAKIFKEKVGAEFLTEAGYNLSQAEAEFGSDWLTR